MVTILFSDVSGSTSLGERLDPESLRGIMSRFFDHGRAIVARHGGTVEKFIGDALMAVFGIPQVHEDDALRAVRAAVDLVAELETVNDELEASYGIRLALRTGLNTGEVAVGAGEVFATGDAVNVTARLEQLAAPGEILISEQTRRLVHHYVELEPLEPTELKGKARPVEIWRLRRLVDPGVSSRDTKTSLVGRERELRLLREAHGRAVASRSCEFLTVLGPAGIGKSRLVQALVESAPSTLNLTGRCLPYGTGITFWPIANVINQAAGIGHGAGADEARAQVRALLGEDDNAELVTDRLAAATGLGGGAPVEEIFWAVRRLVQALARERPLLLVFDDIHWAEPTFLDLLEYLADGIDDAPVLLLCLARPDLLEVRVGWAKGRPNARLLSLEPLDREQTDRLIAALRGGAGVDTRLRERIVSAAEGNPLFIEEMLAVVGDDGEAESDLPPTIQALLAARLDQLDEPERKVVGSASVIGYEFSEPAVAALNAEPPATGVLPGLVRRQYLRVDDESRYGFWHQLIRDAAYGSLPKRVRADLHERYARYLEAIVGERLAEVQEVVGYHLEQAYRSRLDVGLPDDHVRLLGAEASGHLIASGARANARGDLRAAARLLERGLELRPSTAPRSPEAQVLLGATLMELGRLPEAQAKLEEAEAAAHESGDRVTEISAQVARIGVRLWLDAGAADPRAAAAMITELISELEGYGADTALAAAWRVSTSLSMLTADTRSAEEAAGRAFEYARRVGQLRGEGEALFWSVLCLLSSPTPVDEALRRCNEALAIGAGPLAEAAARIIAATLHALQGDIERGRTMVAAGRAGFRELGFLNNAVAMAQCEAQVELHGDDLAAADEVLRRSTELLAAAGNSVPLMMHSALRAVILARRGRTDQALALTEQSEQCPALLGQGYWRCARALVFSELGRHGEAIELARSGVGLYSHSGDLHGRGELLEVLYDVLTAAGDDDAGRAALQQARDLFDEKGCTVCTGRTGERLRHAAAATR